MLGKSGMLIAFTLLLMIHSSSSLPKCKKPELEALVKFKHSFTRDSQRYLSSWVGDDCCHWLGVGCDNVTGDVIKLNFERITNDYTNSLVSSELNSALLELEFLSYLDLSEIDFNGSRIPEFIGSMNKLRYLDLSSTIFSGPVPPTLGNLTNLEHLDLFAGSYMLYTQESLKWASNLSKLQYLDMTLVNMYQTYDTLQVLFRLPSLLVLRLNNCSLPTHNLSEVLMEKTSTLQELDLGQNNFEGPFPSFLKIWLRHMTRLETLDLSHNEFQGVVPASLAKLSALKHLDLSHNSLSGLIPDVLKVLGQLTELEYLDISSNSIHGTVSHISNLSQLSTLGISFNNIKLELSTNWRPPFQLEELRAQSCEMNMVFPQWLRNQTKIELLDLSYTGISGELPQWLGNFTHLYSLKVAGNKLTGSLPGHITCDGCNLYWLDLHDNMLSGTIPHWLKRLKTILVLDLSENMLSGRILEGENNSSLLSSRNFLIVLDLSDNKFYGEIQIKNPYLDDPFFSLAFLRLQWNDFSGLISSQLCHYTHLTILELANNHLTGHIPRCLGELSFNNEEGYDSDSGIEIQEIIKGTTEKFVGTLGTHSMIDFSCNRLVGTIPEELSNITNLMQLNLSNNHLTGRIPDGIGNLHLLETLDLSNNNLSGMIPQSLSDIQWLSFLNLSYNHLYGPIPIGNQLQTLDDPSIYAGNSGLCGFPLPNKCSKPNSPLSPTDDDHGAEKDDGAKDKLDKLWLYLAIMSGVATGFWGVVLTLVFKKSWRYAYFRFVEKVGDRIYVPLKVRMNRFKRA
ncbi:receptor-like protein EIX2 [Silene latifolia]|uniref:receptor-like protein EIX2 n=1 Tax=Silene latifolia TaxID=37657 RepID=UPI003D76C543